MVKLGCMTLPYAAYPFERALEGIAAAGFRYVSFGLAHDGVDVPDENDAGAGAKLKALFERYQLQPVQLIANNQFEPGQPLERALKRIHLAQELGIPEILTVGVSSYRRFPHEPIPEEEVASRHRAFVEQYRRIAEAALPYDVTITIKPHTGNTATARDILNTLREIGMPNVQGCYDPGNVEVYEGISSAEDFLLMAHSTYSIIAKDHRGARANLEFPVPGSGDVDFLQIFKSWQPAEATASVIVERVDVSGAPAAEKVDNVLSQSYKSTSALLEAAGILQA